MSAEIRYLVDTHILLWALDDEPRLLPRHREIFLGDAIVWVSAITILEIAIKKSLGKLSLGVDIVELLRASNISILPVNEQHAARVKHLPLHHRDPFDRALIAQAQIEAMTLLTADEHIKLYDVAQA